MNWSFSSLRSRAVYLVLLAILPLLALILYSYFNQRQRAIHEVQRDELVAARNLAVIQETLISNGRQLLITLAQMPQVQSRDRDGCDALFARLLEKTPQHTIIAAADPEGRMFASAPRASNPVNVADRLWFQKAIQTRDFFIGEPLIGRISGKYSLNMSYPILDQAGRLQGAVVVGVDLNWLGSLLARSDFPPGTAMGLTDSTKKVIFRYPKPRKYIGRMLPKALLKGMSVGNEGVAHGVGLPGDPRLFAFARLSSPWQEMFVAIGLPRDMALIGVNRSLWKNLAWLLAVALLALAAAWLGGDWFIIRPVRKLRHVTEKLAAGDLTARAGPDYTVGELGQLAHAFDQMANSLQNNEAELKQTAEELRSRVRELDQRSRQLEAANKELGNFTYSVAHDLRAPLRAIGGFAGVLLEDYPDKLDEDGRRYLQIINQNAGKMGQLIDDLLSLSRLGRKELSLVRLDMAELTKAVCEELKAISPTRKLQFDLQPLPEVLGDRSLMRQVLLNLLQNAIKFTQGREIALIQVSGWSEDGENVYCIKDNGVGFDMKYVQKLFEVFERLHNEEFEGTGVGLAIVKRIIGRHGGRVWAEGKVSEGAAFYFTIPQRKET